MCGEVLVWGMNESKAHVMPQVLSLDAVMSEPLR